MINLKYAPVFLVTIVCIAAAVVAVNDASQRSEFMKLAGVVIAGFWGWMQQPTTRD